MSASTTPTLSPVAAIAWARLTVTDDLPTPPLPLATAMTRVSEPGWAKGISLAGLPPRSVSCRPERCSSVITPRLRSTPVTPATCPTAAVTSRVILSLSGQPATVSSTRTATTPSAPTLTASTMPISVMGRLISGSLTVASAAQISGWSCAMVLVAMLRA